MTAWQSASNLPSVNSRDDSAIRWWPWALTTGGALGFAGGMLHPGMDSALSGPAALAGWVGDPLWLPSHGLILAAFMLLLPGLLGLSRSRVPLSATARRAAWIATATLVLLILEGIPHFAAAFDETAVLAGQPAPFLTGHLFGSAVIYPVFGLALAALAVLSGRNLTHPIIGVLSAIGAVAWGFAPLAIGPLGIDGLDVLFNGAQLWTAWFAVVGLRALAQRRSGVLSATTAPSNA